MYEMNNNTTTTTTNIQFLNSDFHTLQHRIIGTILVSLCLLVGVIGNVMVIIVVYRTPNMKTPTNIYLVSLAFADCLALLCMGIPYLFEFHVVLKLWVFGDFGCRVIVYLQYLTTTASILSITSFTVERYIAVCQPMKAQKLCTMERAKKIILCGWLLALAYNSPWLALVKVRNVNSTSSSSFNDKRNYQISKCDFSIEKRRNVLYTTIYLCDLILFYVIPLLITCVLYTLITKSLLKKHTSKNNNNQNNNAEQFQLSNTAVPETIMKNTTTTTTTTTSSSGSNATTKTRPNTMVSYHRRTCNLDRFVPIFRNNSSRNKSRTQVIKMLAVVTALFTVLWMPYRIWVVYNSFASKPQLNLWLRLFCRTLVYVNCAINPILYNIMSMKFRRAFFSQFCNLMSSTTTTTTATTTTTSTSTSMAKNNRNKAANCKSKNNNKNKFCRTFYQGNNSSVNNPNNDSRYSQVTFQTLEIQ